MDEEFIKKFALVSVKDGLVSSINEFLKKLLSNDAVEGIIVPNEVPNGPGFIPALITNPANLETANPLAPIMPVNASKAVMDFTRLTPSQKLVVAVLKPCESRALLELVKLKQANLDNLVILGIDCPGTMSIQKYNDSFQDNDQDDKTKKNEKNGFRIDPLYEIYENSKEHPELRSACSSCENFYPSTEDIIIGLFGLNIKSEFLMVVQTPLGQQVIGSLDLKSDNKSDKQQRMRDEVISNLKDTRDKVVTELITATEQRIKGLDNFMNVLSPCINCHNCMTVCPICYCKECFFESPTFDLESEKYLQMAEYKGAIRLPANMFLFHITRFNHMVLSCTACGMCEQGCPVDIPLLSIYKTVGLNAQKVFNYEPGRSLEEEIPILTFEEDELEPR